jgi:segregation and condensation protein A
MPFTVKHQLGEGPLDVVLTLIEERKLFVGDVSLAAITDDFVTYVQSQPIFPLEDVSSFIAVATTLLLIKSKALLPTLSLTADESHDIQDLEQRLAILEQVRAFAVDVVGKAAAGTGERARQGFFQAKAPARTTTFAPATDATLTALHQTLQQLLQRAEREKNVAPALPHAHVRPTIKLEEVLVSLRTRIEHAISTSFRDITKEHAQEPLVVVVHFLALLELIKNGIVHAHQQESHKEQHADIRIETRTIGVPRYS